MSNRERSGPWSLCPGVRHVTADSPGRTRGARPQITNRCSLALAWDEEVGQGGERQEGGSSQAAVRARQQGVPARPGIGGGSRGGGTGSLACLWDGGESRAFGGCAGAEARAEGRVCAAEALLTGAHAQPGSILTTRPAPPTTLCWRPALTGGVLGGAGGRARGAGRSGAHRFLCRWARWKGALGGTGAQCAKSTGRLRFVAVYMRRSKAHLACRCAQPTHWQHPSGGRLPPGRRRAAPGSLQVSSGCEATTDLSAEPSGHQQSLPSMPLRLPPSPAPVCRRRPASSSERRVGSAAVTAPPLPRP